MVGQVTVIAPTQLATLSVRICPTKDGAGSVRDSTAALLIAMFPDEETLKVPPSPGSVMAQALPVADTGP